ASAPLLKSSAAFFWSFAVTGLSARASLGNARNCGAAKAVRATAKRSGRLVRPDRIRYLSRADVGGHRRRERTTPGWALRDRRASRDGRYGGDLARPPRRSERVPARRRHQANPPAP